MDTMLHTDSRPVSPERRLKRATAAALMTAAGLGLATADASAQDASSTTGVRYSPVGAAETPYVNTVASRQTVARENRLRSFIERAEPAPRVQALVEIILPPEVQVAVVRNAPDGLGSFYPNVGAVGYENLYSSSRRSVRSGTRGLIVLDAKLEDRGKSEAIAFVLAHEYARLRLGHGHPRHQADAFAREMLKALGLWSLEGAASAFELATGVPMARVLVPSVVERLRALEEPNSSQAGSARLQR